MWRPLPSLRTLWYSYTLHLGDSEIAIWIQLYFWFPACTAMYNTTMYPPYLLHSPYPSEILHVQLRPRHTYTIHSYPSDILHVQLYTWHPILLLHSLHHSYASDILHVQLRSWHPLYLLSLHHTLLQFCHPACTATPLTSCRATYTLLSFWNPVCTVTPLTYYVCM
jgi:hypothetical protein